MERVNGPCIVFLLRIVQIDKEERDEIANDGGEHRGVGFHTIAKNTKMIKTMKRIHF